MYLYLKFKNLVANFKVEEDKTNFQNEKLKFEGEKKKLEEEKAFMAHICVTRP